MSYAQKNISGIVDYFESGCKKDKFLGLEIEHFVVEKTTRRSVSYDGGVEGILRRLAPLYGEPIISEGHIIGIKREGADITLEPAAQLEISIGPARVIEEIAQVYNEFSRLISPILQESGFELVCAGYHPLSKVDDLPVIPKKRYSYMDEYFKTSGTMGKNMMKGSAATQVSIDYESEGDFKKKFRVANILGPFFAFLCDNTNVFEGKPFNWRMARTLIWNNVDPVRSMVFRKALDRGFGFKGYAEYVYNTPPIFYVENGETIYSGSKPASEIYADKLMTKEEIEHIISMMFPDVSLKKRLEIRMADSMPIDRALAYTALIKGIFYNEKSVDTLFEETQDLGNRDVAKAKSLLTEKGLESEVYGKSAADWIEKIHKMAFDGLSADEQKYLEPLAPAK